MMGQSGVLPTVPSADIHNAARSNDLFTIKKYIEEQHVNINTLNEVLDTALHVAARRGHVSICKYLIDKGIDMYIRNEDGRTAMHVCCVNNNLPVYKLLLESSGDHYLQESHVLLYISFEHRSDSVCRYLLENGADADRRYDESNGGGLLHLCEYCGNMSGVAMLAAFGANIYLRNNFGKYGLENCFFSNQENYFLSFFECKIGKMVQDFQVAQVDDPDPIFSFPPISRKLTEDILIHNVFKYVPLVPLYISSKKSKMEPQYHNILYLRRVCKLWKYWIDKYLFLNWSKLKQTVAKDFIVQSKAAGYKKV